MGWGCGLLVGLRAVLHKVRAAATERSCFVLSLFGFRVVGLAVFGGDKEVLFTFVALGLSGCWGLRSLAATKRSEGPLSPFGLQAVGLAVLGGDREVRGMPCPTWAFGPSGPGCDGFRF